MTHSPPLGLTARGELRRVIDGDTLEVDLAFLGISVKLRLLDCWCPEANSPEGQEATEFMREMIGGAGTSLTVHIPTTGARTLRDLLTFDRILAEVWVAGDHQSLNERMVYAGHATERKP